MKKLLMILSCFLGFSVMAQDVSNADLEKGWQLLTTKDGINLYVKKELCKVEPFSQELVFVMVKIENNSNSDISANLALGLHYDSGCIGCEEQNETSRTVNIPANSSIEGNCTFDRNELTYLISNPNHGDIRIFNGVELVVLNID